MNKHYNVELQERLERYLKENGLSQAKSGAPDGPGARRC